jgi:hypothetical protein
MFSERLVIRDAREAIFSLAIFLTRAALKTPSVCFLKVQWVTGPYQEAAMFILERGFILLIAILMLSSPAFAEEVSKEQIKSLDEQVQDIKADTLGIATQMRLLEEKLLYPSSTQVAVYLSLDKAAKYRPDSIEIQLEGKPVTYHLYNAKEVAALKKGGVQRLYMGNIKSGEHDLQVLLSGKNAGGLDFYRDEKFTFSKETGPKVVEIRLINAADEIITLRDW